MRNWIAPVFTPVAVAAVLLLTPNSASAGVPLPESSTKLATYVVADGDWLSKIAARYCGSAGKWSSLYAANRSVIGSNPNLIHPGQRLVLSCATGQGAPRVSTPGGWVAPLSTWSLSSCFGMRFDPYYHRWQLHDGLDLSVPRGTRVHAIHAGVVIRAGWSGGWGNMVEINHGGGVTTLYAHQSRISARVGQRVAKGQTIGYSGSTGASTGPHLHLRLHLNGKPANPAPFLRSHGIRIGC